VQTKSMFHYFISYTFVTGQGQSFGNCDVRLPAPVTGMEDVRRLEQALRDRHHVGSVVILSFARLAAEQPN